MFRLAVAAAVSVLTATPVLAQDLGRQVDEIFGWVTTGSPGCVVAAEHEGRQVVHRAYGLANVEAGVPMTTAALMDIGSVQKQFLAASVLLLVEEGRLALTDEVRKYIPELPDYGHALTIDHLLTHTSGVRDWTALLNFSPDDEEAFTAILRQRELNFVPGTEWSYSNSNFVLARKVVERVSGLSFPEFASTRLFAPLGMQETRYTDELGKVTTLTPAYQKEGDGWVRAMMLGSERGGGALFSTASDLLKWNDALTNARLSAFVSQKLQEPTRLSNGRELSYARGLQLDRNRGGQVIWHGGSADGYKTFLGRYPEQRISIAIVCNAGDQADAVTRYARGIYELLVPDVAALDYEDRVAREPPQGVPGIDPSGRAGLYFSEGDGQPLRLVTNQGRLGIAGGGPLVTLSAEKFRNPDPTLSFMSQASFELHFDSDDSFEIVTAEGEHTRYHRARPWSPTAAELADLSGRYVSDELKATFDIEPTENGVRIQLNELPTQAIPFQPADIDTFQWQRMQIRFVRDAEGRVVALDYSNPVFRSVTFVREGSR